MMNNDTNRLTDTPMTVADLRNLLASLPDHTELWVFDAENSEHRPVTSMSHDKRVNGLNLWIKE